MRYKQTKAFRHDIKNHLSVLNGLLNNGKTEEGKAYLKKLGQARARGIMAEVSVVLPKAWVMDDFDLCVIFANALDNAVNACQEGKGTKSIHVLGSSKVIFICWGLRIPVLTTRFRQPGPAFSTSGPWPKNIMAQ